MNKKTEIKKIINFLKEAYNDLTKNPDECCCWHHPIGDQELCLVAASIWNESENKYEPRVKIAYNSDSLQCDYDWDWDVPCFKDNGDCAFVEIPVDMNVIKSDADYLYNEVKAMDKMLRTGELVKVGR